jgi:hypothetical protein
MRWRRSYDARPPDMTKDHPHFDTINNDARYRTTNNHLDESESENASELENENVLPLAESLEDCQTRVLDAWKGIVQDAIKAKDSSSHTLVVAHANTLRALVMYLDHIPANDIEDLNIPTGIPFYYNICKTSGEVLHDDVDNNHNHGNTTSSSTGDQATTSVPVSVSDIDGFRGIYISDDRKKRSFLERRRAANDPWLWALHDDQVSKSMLEDNNTNNNNKGDSEGEGDSTNGLEESAQDLVDMAKEALENTELFSTTTSISSARDADN